MVTISLCMIVKNEEDVLARCLDCMTGAADQIIIVDTGSTDGTKEIARQYTSFVYDFSWMDDFASARNFSFSKATCDYVMWLDADDILTPEDGKKLCELKQTLEPTVDTVMMKYCSSPEEDGSITLSYRRERLVKRSRNFRWYEPVHEYINFSGCIINSDITVLHKKNKPGEAGRNLRIYTNFLAGGGELSTRGLYYYARELYYARRCDEAISYYRLFLSKEDGWVEDKLSACNELADCCKLTRDEQGRLESHLLSLKYDLPRAENCCGIAFYYMDRQDYSRAAFWFELVLRLEKPKDCWGFILNDLWDFVPTIQLCVCYDKLGNSEKSLMYHELSKAMRPNHPSVLNNQQYFDSLKPAAESTGDTNEAGFGAEAENNADGSNGKSTGCDVKIAATSSHVFVRKTKPAGNKLTLSMLVRNEAGHFLEKVLKQHAEYIDAAVILDDASTDNTLSICCECLKNVPAHLIHNTKPGFSNEINLRKQQWEETLKTDPDWILYLDADELFEDAFAAQFRYLINQDQFDLFSFRLYDFWNDTQYREDRYWCAHQYYRPFLIRPQKDFRYIWEETPQHCGRMPKNVFELPNTLSSLRLKHFGWSTPELRKEKADRYMRLDPDARYGIKEQYESILDESPNLIHWVE